MPKKEKKEKKNKKGGCNCSGSLFSGGAGGNNVTMSLDNKSISLPSSSTYPLNFFSGDSSRSPITVSGRDNIMIKGGKKEKNNKTKKNCVMMPLVVVPIMSTPKKMNKNKSMKKGGTNVLYDFFLGPSNAMTPLTSFGTISGSVTSANALSSNISATNPHAWSQPIGTKFTATNLVYV